MTAVLLSCALVWAVFLALHHALNGRWWPWLAVSLLPPLVLAAVALKSPATTTGFRLAARSASRPAYCARRGENRSLMWR